MRRYHHIKTEEDWKRVKELIKPGDVLVPHKDVKPRGLTAPFRKGLKYQWGKAKYHRENP
jgi:hypothetical protein